MPLSARRHVFIRQEVLWPAREAPVNPERTPADDADAVTAEVKALAREMGAQLLGIAAYDPRFLFADATERDHTRVIVMGVAMSFDCMIDIGQRSQDETHRVYYQLDDMANRLAHHLGAYGYSACAQHNNGDLPLPAYGYLAGLGELGKHGSLISPEYGSSFRLVAVSTDMPLVVDGPRDSGIDEVCQSCMVCSRFCPGDAIPRTSSSRSTDSLRPRRRRRARFGRESLGVLHSVRDGDRRSAVQVLEPNSGRPTGRRS
jgi:ferredoxin